MGTGRLKAVKLEMTHIFRRMARLWASVIPVAARLWESAVVRWVRDEPFSQSRGECCFFCRGGV